jgi:transcriptional regulator with XRE-family HTH domain
MNLKEYMFRHEITYKKLAELSGYSVSFLCAVKNGGLKPTLRAAKAISEATNQIVSIEELINGT